jgi:hypothetical protein
MEAMRAIYYPERAKLLSSYHNICSLLELFEELKERNILPNIKSRSPRLEQILGRDPSYMSKWKRFISLLHP